MTAAPSPAARQLPALAPKKSRGRRTHVIRENDRCYSPTLRAYVDTEAVRTPIDRATERQTLAFGWLAFERVERKGPKETMSVEWLRFTDPDTAFLALTRHTRSHSTLYVYAHNLGYDAAMLSLATMCAKYEWQIEEYVNASHLMWVTISKDRNKVCFIDTLNYFATSLAKLGEGIGAPKLKMPNGDVSGDEWDTYCKNDVEVLRTAMHTYFDLIVKEDLGGYKKTLASQAFGAWRHRFMHHRVLVLDDPRIEALERSAYHGGRSEVFYDLPIQSTIYGVDVNSMYPAMMREYLYPAAKIDKGFGGTIDDLRQLLSEGAVVASVGINTDEPCYPYATEDRIIYPVGTFVTTLTTPELQYALSKGHVVCLGQWVLYDQQPLFKDYVETLYQLRLDYKKQGNDAFAYMLKIMLNSLYGKFGQRGYKWLRCDGPPLPNAMEWRGNCEENGPSMLHRERMGELWHQVQEGEAYESCPAIAAHVTAYARMHLWQLINTAGRGHVYYTDTDSLYVDETGYVNLAGHIDATSLGKLKLEGRYGGGQFRAPKDYHLLDSWRVKGVRKTAQRLSANTYEQDQFESYDAVLGRGCDGEIIVKRLKKTVSRTNYQSVGNGVGWRTPHQLG